MKFCLLRSGYEVHLALKSKIDQTKRKRKRKERERKEGREEYLRSTLEPFFPEPRGAGRRRVVEGGGWGLYLAMYLAMWLQWPLALQWAVKGFGILKDQRYYRAT